MSSACSSTVTISSSSGIVRSSVGQSRTQSLMITRADYLSALSEICWSFPKSFTPTMAVPCVAFLLVHFWIAFALLAVTLVHGAVTIMPSSNHGTKPSNTLLDILRSLPPWSMPEPGMPISSHGITMSTFTHLWTMLHRTNEGAVKPLKSTEKETKPFLLPKRKTPYGGVLGKCVSTTPCRSQCHAVLFRRLLDANLSKIWHKLS